MVDSAATSIRSRDALAMLAASEHHRRTPSEGRQACRLLSLAPPRDMGPPGSLQRGIGRRRAAGVS